MGHYQTGSDSQIVQSITSAIGGGGSFAVPAYFNNRIYYTGKTDSVKAFIITNGVIVDHAANPLSASSIGAFTGSPVVSANGTNNGIVWATDPGAYASSGPAVLHAYNATNLALELYNSSQNLARDNPGGAVKMTAPVVAGGKVYVGAEYALSVYGPAIFLTAPTISPGGRRVHQFRDGHAGGRDGGRFHLLHAGRHDADHQFHALHRAVQPDEQRSGSGHRRRARRGQQRRGQRVVRQHGGGGQRHRADRARITRTTPARIRSPARRLWCRRMRRSISTGARPGRVRSVGATNFTVRWTGSVQPQFNETYTFLHHRRRRRAAVDQRPVADQRLGGQDQRHDQQQQHHARGPAALQHRTGLLSENQQRRPSRLSWSSPSTPQAIMPQTQLVSLHQSAARRRPDRADRQRDQLHRQRERDPQRRCRRALQSRSAR